MRRMVPAMAMVLLLTGAAGAQQSTTNDKVMRSLPGDAFTITDYYKQNIYDPSDKKIGDIKDVLIDKAGQIKALMISVGGFLGAGEKDVAVPFNAVKSTTKNNKTYLTMNASKDELKNAVGFKYVSSTTKWAAENK
jgi:sporulation protein YlmC with PRC-barrel domain